MEIDDLEINTDKKALSFAAEVEKYYENAKNSEDALLVALDGLCKIISEEKSPIRMDAMMSKVVDVFGVKKAVLKSNINKIKNRLKEEVIDISEKEVTEKLSHLKWLTKEKKEEAFFKQGFTTCEEPNDFGYWFGTAGFNIDRMTNFIINPLFSVNEPDEKFELIEIVNRHQSTILEVPAGGFTSMDKFEQLIWQARAVLLGNFGKQQLRLLNAKHIFDFKQATLVRTLGMQPEGFWSYADALYYQGKLVRYNNTGITTVDGKTFYSPGAAEHNRSQRTDEFGQEVKEGDPYRNDKYLSYQTPAVNFETWCNQMVKVFGTKAYNAIAFVILSVNKDIVAFYEKVPLLYGYGDAESGKSAWAERIFYFFFSRELKPFNLNSGTVFSFFNTMERFKNCPYVFNEFDEDNINEEFFRAFKQAFDGEGRNKGMMGSSVKNKSIEQPINVAPLLIGQILTTKDGGSVLTRTVPEKFVGRTYTDEQKKEFDRLIEWERNGMNGCICELLQHRAQFRKDFFPAFNQVLSQLKTDIQNDGQIYKERIARNHAILLTCVKLMAEKFSFGFTYDTYYKHMLGSVVNLTQMVNESNNLGIFWKEIVFMFEQQTIEEGFDYKVVTVSEILVSVVQEGRKVEITKRFEQPKKLLMLRLSSIFPMFEQRVKMSTGSKSINQKTLITYFESNPAYLGNNPTSHFSSERKKIAQKTSSFVFDYDLLGVNMERNVAESDAANVQTLTGRVMRDPERVTIGNDYMMRLVVVSYKQEGFPLKTYTIYINCFVPSSIDTVVKKEDIVTVTGYLTEADGFKRTDGKRTSFKMDVTELKIGQPNENIDDPSFNDGNSQKLDDLPF